MLQIDAEMQLVEELPQKVYLFQMKHAIFKMQNK